VKAKGRESKKEWKKKGKEMWHNGKLPLGSLFIFYLFLPACTSISKSTSPFPFAARECNLSSQFHSISSTYTFYFVFFSIPHDP